MLHCNLLFGFHGFRVNHIRVVSGDNRYVNIGLWCCWVRVRARVRDGRSSVNRLQPLHLTVGG